MTLIVYYVVFMIVGDFAAYFLGLFTEYSRVKKLVAIQATVSARRFLAQREPARPRGRPLQAQYQCPVRHPRLPGS